MSYKKILCCCCDDGMERLNESGCSKEGEGVRGVVNEGVSGVDNEGVTLEVVEEAGAASVEVVSEDKVEKSKETPRNPRNKCVLKPGHSQMDWVRLSKSQDLSGMGDKAGTMEVTPEELARHNSITDGWLALNGRVYNVTRYFPFHPGGVDELRKGLGKDATKMFLEAHNWVNSHSLLKSCHVGRLVPSHHLEPLVKTPPTQIEVAKEPEDEEQDTHMNNLEKEVEKSQPLDIVPNQPINCEAYEAEVPRILPDESLSGFSFRSFNEDPDLGLSTSNQFNRHLPVIVRSIPSFAWVQKTASLCIAFVTKPLANPMVEAWKNGNTVTVVIRYDSEGKTVVNEVLFDEEVSWPGVLRVLEEDGKVELNLMKVTKKVWYNYGVLKQTVKTGAVLEHRRTAYVLTKKEEIAEDLFLLGLSRKDGSQIYAPIGYHFRVFTGPDDEGISRSYTPIPDPDRDLFPKIGPAMRGGVDVNLLVKRYELGYVSRYVCDSDVGTDLYMSRPQSGGPTLSKLYHRNRFLMIAAGTGITPMLSLFQFLLQRRQKICVKLGLLNCNRRIQSIPFLTKMKELLEETEENKRVYLRHILSDPEETIPQDCQFIKGRITEEIVAEALRAVCREKIAIEEDYFVFVCGPTSFNEACQSYLQNLSVPKDQIHVFDG